MTDYSRIRRQWLALIAGAIVGCPIALAVLISNLSSESLLGFGRAAAHAPQVAILGLYIFGFIAVIIVANHLLPVVAGFVIVSLAYDAYMLRDWRASKFTVLCIGAAALGGVWYWLSTYTEKFLEILSWADVAPCLSSLFALVLTFSALMTLRNLRTSAK